ncbi:unnamed protein product [Prorocentrum cordatum]|uniref:TFIIS N-terminal domain-containing protein n=1 Tax=Prorocentrum cordatum TaxID=2364126 RepID=A0ABN9Q968_9DINO|nr:unnamed protein product [Polarella glacialis]
MPSQLVLSVRARALPPLSRGWCTPDPSPTRTSNGLPSCAASTWEEADLPDGLDVDARGSPCSPDRRGGAAGAARVDAASGTQDGAATGLELEPRLGAEGGAVVLPRPPGSRPTLHAEPAGACAAAEAREPEVGAETGVPAEQLAALAARLRATPGEDADALCEVLEALSAVPATLQLLQKTDLGVLTQPLKDHASGRVRSAAQRLRRGWKSIVSEAKKRSAGEARASSPRGHDQDRGATSSSCGDSAPAVAALSSVARAGTTPVAAWARIRTPSLEARVPPPAVPVATAAQRGLALAREAKLDTAEPECAPLDSFGLRESFEAAWASAATPSQLVLSVRAPPGLSRGWRTPDPSPTRTGAAMPSQLVLNVRVRAPPGLSRGWRTPDPSPTRTPSGLPCCVASPWEATGLPDGLDVNARDNRSGPDQRGGAADAARVDATSGTQGSSATGPGPEPCPGAEGGAVPPRPPPARAGAASGSQGSSARGLELEQCLGAEGSAVTPWRRGQRPAASDDAASYSQGSAAIDLELEPRLDDYVLVEAGTPRGHDHLRARGGPMRRASGGACGGSASAADAASSAARARATAVVAWARSRTPSPEARAQAPQAPLAWRQGALAEKPPRWMPFWQPAAEPAPPPPPPPPVAAAAPRGRAPARGAKAALARPQCAPAAPKDPKAVLSVGSVGHPYTCQEPCKYVRKTRGCKDGSDCNRCHACSGTAARQQALRRSP